jgi:hypothetical protein
MRRAEPPPFDEYDAWVNAGPRAVADWKAGVESVLEDVDRQLKERGLEVIIYDTDGDECCWEIAPAQPSS